MPHPFKRQSDRFRNKAYQYADGGKIPLPRPDLRSWSDRSVKAKPEDDLPGAIHPDTLLERSGVTPSRKQGDAIDYDSAQWPKFQGHKNGTKQDI